MPVTNIEQLEAYFEKKLPELMDCLGKVVNLESPSHENKSISDQCGLYLQKLFSEVGFFIRVLHQDCCGDHIIAEYGEETGEDILLVGHYDTVYPIGTIEKMPFLIEGDIARGPGILDMKGGIILGLFAFKGLQELGLLPKKKITFFLNSDEESGSFHSSEQIVAVAKKHKHVLVLEPGVDGIGTVKIDRYGRGTYDITAHGKAAHSGSHPEQAVSPLLELAHQLIRIDEMNDYAGGVSLAPTYITGGVYGTCMVPENAKISVDVRTRTAELSKKMDEIMFQLKPADEKIHLEITGGIDKPPLVGDRELLECVRNIATEVGVTTEEVVSSGGSDGNFTSGAGVSTLDGLGMSGANLHNPEEYIHISHIPKRGAILAKLMMSI